MRQVDELAAVGQRTASDVCMADKANAIITAAEMDKLTWCC